MIPTCVSIDQSGRYWDKGYALFNKIIILSDIPENIDISGIWGGCTGGRR
jgi:hypothetical protein